MGNFWVLESALSNAMWTFEKTGISQTASFIRDCSRIFHFFVGEIGAFPRLFAMFVISSAISDSLTLVETTSDMTHQFVTSWQVDWDLLRTHHNFHTQGRLDPCGARRMGSVDPLGSLVVLMRSHTNKLWGWDLVCKNLMNRWEESSGVKRAVGQRFVASLHRRKSSEGPDPEPHTVSHKTWLDNCCQSRFQADFWCS